MNHVAVPMLTLGLSLVPALCWAVGANADQAIAVAQIKRLGGTVTIDERIPGKPVTAVDLSRHEVLLEILDKLSGVTGAAPRRAPAPQVTNAELVCLKGLRQLQSLKLMYTQVTDAGLEYLEELTDLRSLDLSHTQVTDAGLEHLQRLTKLQSLNLRVTHVTDAGVKKFQKELPKCDIKH